MNKPSVVSYRRIDQLKQLAYDCNLTNEQARAFGKLTATSTWESLLTKHGLEFPPKNQTTDDIVASGVEYQPTPTNFLEWVDFGQLITLTLAGVGIFALLLSLWPRTLNFIPRPVRITIQIGAK
jgi:hypothetical protein